MRLYMRTSDTSKPLVPHIKWAITHCSNKQPSLHCTKSRHNPSKNYRLSNRMLQVPLDVYICGCGIQQIRVDKNSISIHLQKGLTSWPSIISRWKFPYDVKSLCTLRILSTSLSIWPEGVSVEAKAQAKLANSCMLHKIKGSYKMLQTHREAKGGKTFDSILHANKWITNNKKTNKRMNKRAASKQANKTYIHRQTWDRGHPR